VADDVPTQIPIDSSSFTFPTTNPARSLVEEPKILLAVDTEHWKVYQSNLESDLAAYVDLVDYGTVRNSMRPFAKTDTKRCSSQLINQAADAVSREIY
jgi:hypothetical protein